MYLFVFFCPNHLRVSCSMMPLYCYVDQGVSYYCEKYCTSKLKKKKELSKKQEIKIHLDSSYPEINFLLYSLPVLFYVHIQIFYTNVTPCVQC